MTLTRRNDGDARSRFATRTAEITGHLGSAVRAIVHNAPIWPTVRSLANLDCLVSIINDRTNSSFTEDKANRHEPLNSFDSFEPAAPKKIDTTWAPNLNRGPKFSWSKVRINNTFGQAKRSKHGD